MRERRHSLPREMPQPYQPKLKTMANSKTWTWGVQRLQAPRQTKTQSPPKVKALRKQGQGERLEPAMRERPEEPGHSRKPRSSNRAGEEPRMRRRRHSLLQKMPQPQQPKLKKTMANSMRWTGGVQSLPAPRQTKTRSPPKAQALMREREDLEEPEPGPSSRSTTRIPVVLRPNLGAQRPRTPSRSPRRRPTRQPSARAVQLVQEHMRACRQRRSQMCTH